MIEGRVTRSQAKKIPVELEEILLHDVIPDAQQKKKHTKRSKMNK
jgi:hypothetical protein